MDVFNSPLNLAHQQGRKAEAYVAKGKFCEAVQCHQRAGELLSKSLLLTKYADALKSIKLQEGHHRRQIAVIQDRQARLARQLQMSRNANMFTDPNESETSPVEHHSNDISQYAYQTFDQLDTMLQNFNFGGPVASSKETTSDANYTRATKMDKNDETRIEELKLTINSLHDHFRELSNESERLRQELKTERADKERLKELNAQLSRKLAVYEGSVEACETDHKKYTSSLDINFFPLELPPLEIPKY